MYLAIDYGKKRIGLATGSLIPRGAGVLDGAKPKEQLISEIRKIIEDNEVTGIVLGLPIRSQGEEGALAAEIREFGALLQDDLQLPIFLEPEQFSSAEAEQQLASLDKKIKPGDVDQMAAIIILEQFLRSKQ